jgi:hypothetical protein
MCNAEADSLMCYMVAGLLLIFLVLTVVSVLFLWTYSPYSEMPKERRRMLDALTLGYVVVVFIFGLSSFYRCQICTKIVLKDTFPFMAFQKEQ